MTIDPRTVGFRPSTHHGPKIRYIAGLALLLALIHASSLIAMNCEEDTISEVSGSGAIIEMLSGAIYKVDATGQVDSALWLTAEDVLVCSESVIYKGRPYNFYKLINKDEGGEEVEATRLQ